MTERVLYGYFRSSTSYRVRLALNLKGLAYRHEAVNLLKGEQHGDYLGVNPQGLLPTLVDDGKVLTQSLAICEYLDEAYPQTHRLLPGDAGQRATIRAIAQAIACDIHPLNNQRVMKYLAAELDIGEAGRNEWFRHWIGLGLAAVEKQVAQTAGQFAVGDAISLADICLVPQIFSARRFNVDISACPTLLRIDAVLNEREEFIAAHPSQQPDFVA